MRRSRSRIHPEESLLRFLPEGCSSRFCNRTSTRSFRHERRREKRRLCRSSLPLSRCTAISTRPRPRNRSLGAVQGRRGGWGRRLARILSWSGPVCCSPKGSPSFRVHEWRFPFSVLTDEKRTRNANTRVKSMLGWDRVEYFSIFRGLSYLRIFIIVYFFLDNFEINFKGTSNKQCYIKFF